MPNPAIASVQQTPPPPARVAGDQNKEEHSADESWSAGDSDNDRVAPNNSNAAQSLKRKRPLTVSYVTSPPPSPVSSIR
ncbi:hypothetical protein V6Z79_009396 [Aspergillus fumigatus]